MSIRDQIFSSQDIPHKIVEVPVWGVTVEVRGMTGAERTHILNLAAQSNGVVDLQVVYPEIVIATAHDPETGEKVFESNDRVALMSKSAQALDLLAQAGMELSGFTQEAQETAGKSFPEATA